MAEEAKEKFEKEKSDVLKALPKEIRESFGTIGFSPRAEDDDDEAASQLPYLQPVLIVSPYDVPPKPIRDIYWMDAFTKAKRSKAKLKKLDYLAYVYGSDNPNDCYNFVTHEDFVTLEEGKTNGFGVIPPEVSSKPESERTSAENKLVRGIEEMNVELAKAPEDRRNHGTPFLEAHEKLQSKDREDSKDQPPAKKQKT